MTPFDRARAELNSVVDRHMARLVEVRPMQKGNYGTVSDPTRVSFTAPAQVSATSKIVETSGTNSEDWRTSIVARRGTLSMDVIHVPPGFDFLTGDIVIALELPGQPRFEVMARDPYRFDRVRLDLSRI